MRNLESEMTYSRNVYRRSWCIYTFFYLKAVFPLVNFSSRRLSRQAGFPVSKFINSVPREYAPLTHSLPVFFSSDIPLEIIRWINTEIQSRNTSQEKRFLLNDMKCLISRHISAHENGKSHSSAYLEAHDNVFRIFFPYSQKITIHSWMRLKFLKKKKSKDNVLNTAHSCTINIQCKFSICKTRV